MDSRMAFDTRAGAVKHREISADMGETEWTDVGATTSVRGLLATSGIARGASWSIRPRLSFPIGAIGMDRTIQHAPLVL
jgi:hypothetical protein